MFWNAASFDQDLCSWGSKIGSSANVTNMFGGSGCSDTGTPDLSGIPSPLCEVCVAPSLPPSQSPGVGPSVSQSPSASSTQNCMTTTAELYDAVDAYLEDGPTSTAANTYGYPIGTWCVSKITDMDQLFQNKNTFNEDIGQWDVSKVTNMEAMFSYAYVSMIKIL